MQNQIGKNKEPIVVPRKDPLVLHAITQHRSGQMPLVPVDRWEAVSLEKMVQRRRRGLVEPEDKDVRTIPDLNRSSTRPQIDQQITKRRPNMTR
jgi:PHD/YefM family antitoxin component YafN of YafNO toxin-antitoxin module